MVGLGQSALGEFLCQLQYGRGWICIGGNGLPVLSGTLPSTHRWLKGKGRDKCRRGCGAVRACDWAGVRRRPRPANGPGTLLLKQLILNSRFIEIKAIHCEIGKTLNG